jgi:hypothetical protein
VLALVSDHGSMDGAGRAWVASQAKVEQTDRGERSCARRVDMTMRAKY